jgi:hypothetical protein
MPRGGVFGESDQGEYRCCAVNQGIEASLKVQ